MKIYRFFVVVSLMVFLYLLGGITGYAVGYNDRYAEKVIAYRHGRR